MVLRQLFTIFKACCSIANILLSKKYYFFKYALAYFETVSLAREKEFYNWTPAEINFSDSAKAVNTINDWYGTTTPSIMTYSITTLSMTMLSIAIL